MEKTDLLQKVNEYCSEKSYTEATLTSSFKDKFVDHFIRKYPDGDINDENVLNDMKFALNTAFSGASSIITEKQKGFDTKENEYKGQIAELNKQLETLRNGDDDDKLKQFQIPKELQEQIDELKKYKTAESKKEKFKNIIELAKKGIRQDLHKSFETFAETYDASLDVEDKKQADNLITRFQAIFKDSIGDIKPLAPQQTAKREEEYLASIPKVKIQ